jgi:hypothetical protein
MELRESYRAIFQNVNNEISIILAYVTICDIWRQRYTFWATKWWTEIHICTGHHYHKFIFLLLSKNDQAIIQKIDILISTTQSYRKIYDLLTLRNTLWTVLLNLRQHSHLHDTCYWYQYLSSLMNSSVRKKSIKLHRLSWKC